MQSKVFYHNHVKKWIALHKTKLSIHQRFPNSQDLFFLTSNEAKKYQRQECSCQNIQVIRTEQ